MTSLNEPSFRVWLLATDYVNKHLQNDLPGAPRRVHWKALRCPHDDAQHGWFPRNNKFIESKSMPETKLRIIGRKWKSNYYWMCQLLTRVLRIVWFHCLKTLVIISHHIVLLTALQVSLRFVFLIHLGKTHTLVGRGPGLVVMGDDSSLKGRGFKSWHHILDWHFSHWFVLKIVLFVWKD